VGVISPIGSREWNLVTTSACADAKLALLPDYQEVKNEFIAQSDGAGSGSEVRSAKYRIEELR
jgi:hypothetical protein